MSDPVQKMVFCSTEEQRAQVIACHIKQTVLAHEIEKDREDGSCHSVLFFCSTRLVNHFPISQEDVLWFFTQTDDH